MQILKKTTVYAADACLARNPIEPLSDLELFRSREWTAVFLLFVVLEARQVAHNLVFSHKALMLDVGWREESNFARSLWMLKHDRSYLLPLPRIPIDLGEGKTQRFGKATLPSSPSFSSQCERICVSHVHFCTNKAENVALYGKKHGDNFL